MVYVPDDEQELTEMDWTLVGKRERRLIIFLPDRKEDLHTIARHLSQLASQLHEVPKEYPSHRGALMAAGGLIMQTNVAFKELKRRSETELRERRERREKKYKDVVGIKSSKSA